jgi:hypothetical protein
LEDVLLPSNIVVGHDARLQLGELVPASPNTDMANFLSFDVYDIDLLNVMNDSNLNFVLLQMTSYHHCGRPRSVSNGEINCRELVRRFSYPFFLPVIFLAFKTLANSYLGLKDHKLFSQMDSRVSFSLGKISELMITNRTRRAGL